MEKDSPLPTTSNKILILILNWNGKKDTFECLESLSKISYPNYSILIVDNGSTDNSVQELTAKHPNIPILRTHTNLGFAGGNNVGIQWALKANFDWILLLNNDTTVSPDFLQAFISHTNNAPQEKIFGAKIFRYNDPSCIDHLGGKWNPEKSDFDSLHSGKIDDGVSYEKSQEVDYVCAAAMLVHKDVFLKIGLLEPKFFLFWEETDFCYRARKAGFSIRTAPKAKIWHKVNASFTGGKPHTNYFWWRSRLLWIARNCSPQEKKHLYTTVIFPDLFKTLRHYLLRSLQNKVSYLLLKKPTALQTQKALRNKAGLLGAIHYFLGKFDQGPSWLSKKK